MSARFWSSLLLPVVLLGVAIATFLVTEPLSLLGVSPPPIEQLTVERTVLDEEGIDLKVRATGSEPMHIAQVLVDGAYWRFTQEPAGALGRGTSAWIHLPYPWVEDELHEITFITNTGATFDHTIEVAEATPQASAAQFIGYGLLGLYVGVLPVALGILFRPALQQSGPRGFEFALALTLGLLVFLLVDTLEEGLELGDQAASIFQGHALVWLAALVAFVALMAVGRRHREPPRGLALASYLALGIGLHNLGEGLAIGGSFAAGSAALGTFLVIGFTLHNLTEGIGIAAPLTRERVRWVAWIGLIALAGLPAVLGTWIGAYAYAPHWSALLLGIGAGAILQVMIEVGDFLRRTSIASGGAMISVASISGFTAGIVIMYATAYFVQV
ncbi:metal transporter [Litchfieldella qijiaojingensis]|uniref:Metal transporter n=1 Tax=Litchfieldella qijiaojingensis TaxID=980347 RepID=A0ABQ2YRB5_9GAMM|nr:ZIP family metal transporter [Halomonas qijiaojingensis]GGX89947.1 metal transporter [Halomonas qijiaojingensis]